MRMYECFCENVVELGNEEHLWSFIPHKTVKKMERKIGDPDGPEYFYKTESSHKEGCMETILCPFCNGISVFELRGNRFATLYNLPEKHYEPFTLERPDTLTTFSCSCGKHVETTDFKNQWTMIPEDDLAQEHVGEAFEDGGTVEDYYKNLYEVGRRVITCPHCHGMTVVECDSEGNGVKADYYVRKEEELGDEFDLSLLPD